MAIVQSRNKDLLLASASSLPCSLPFHLLIATQYTFGGLRGSEGGNGRVTERDRRGGLEREFTDWFRLACWGRGGGALQEQAPDSAQLGIKH